MIRIIDGNILDCKENIIVHQVNVQGIMRAVELQDNSPIDIKD